MTKRIDQLDAIRGLAALSVFISHVILIKTFLFTQIMRTPLRLFLSSHADVMLFFILSGFVLSLPFLNSEKVEYTPYILKRIFRIYIPYLISIILAMIMCTLFYNKQILGLSDWFNRSWVMWPTRALILEHVIMLGNIHSEYFDNVIWSLVHEMRISVIFPFIVLIVIRLKLIQSLLVCFILSCMTALNNKFHFQLASGLLTTYFDTLQYISIFIIGTLLAKHRYKLVDLFQKTKTGSKWILFIVLLFMFNYSASVVPLIPKPHNLEVFDLIIEEYGEAFAGCGFIIIAMGSLRVGKVLKTKPLAFLGKISYSLYLYHLNVILACVHLLYDKLPFWLLLTITITITICISYIAWLLIENPCIKIGKAIAAKIPSHNQKLIRT